MNVNRTKIKIEKIAFESKKANRGYKFKATYLEEPKADALIEIFKDDKLVKDFLFPSYKIWNIAAHENDIIDGLEKENEDGLLLAGSTGFGGNAYNE